MFRSAGYLLGGGLVACPIGCSKLFSVWPSTKPSSGKPFKDVEVDTGRNHKSGGRCHLQRTSGGTVALALLQISPFTGKEKSRLSLVGIGYDPPTLNDRVAQMARALGQGRDA